jgi:DNA-binding NarL/FixJ family response regulator
VIASAWHRSPRPRGTAAVAAVVFVGTLAVRLAGSDPLVGWGLLYVAPVVLLTRTRGAGWGLAAGAIGVALEVAWATAKSQDVGAGSVVILVSTYLVVIGAAAAGPGGSAKSTDQTLAESVKQNDREARRRAAQGLSGLGTWEMDLRTGEIQWSDEYHRLYGVDPNGFVPSRQAFDEIIRLEDRKTVRDAFERAAREATTVEVRYQIIRPSDRAERTIRSHIHAQLDSEGKPVRLLGTGQDVTDLVMLLSSRESEVLMLLAEGLSGEQIAAQLVLSPQTVRTHIQNAMVELGAHTRGQAIATALRSDEIGS